MTHSSSTRRAFFEKIGVAGAAVSTLGSLETARGYAANDSLSVACLGTGGRCQHLMTALAKVPGVKMTAVCDVYDIPLENAKKLADPKAIASKQYHALLDRKDIDAVLIASPDHWHVPMAVDACNAGQGRLRRKAAHARALRRQADHRSPEPEQEDRSGRHAAAQHAAYSEGA